MTRVRNLLAALAAGLIVALSAQPSSAALDNDDIDVTLILFFGAGGLFWEPLMQGARDAAALYDVNLDIQFGDADPAKNNTILETAITNSVDGIGILIGAEGAFDDNIKKARAKGIGVVAINTEDPSGAAKAGYQAYVGGRLADHGYKIGTMMVNEYGLKAGDHVLFGVELPGLNYAQQRYAGVSRALDEAGVSSEVLGTGEMIEESLTKISQYLIGHPDTDAVIGGGGAPTAAAPDAVEQAGMDIPTGGFDVQPQILDNILSGRSLATIDQMPYSQGYYTVTQLALQKLYGLTPADMILTGVIDAGNAEQVKALVGKYR